MLAEIFMMRLEAATRAVRETLPSSSSRSCPSPPATVPHWNTETRLPRRQRRGELARPTAICRDRAKCR